MDQANTFSKFYVKKINDLIQEKRVTLFLISGKTKVPYNVVVKFQQGKLDENNHYYKVLKEYLNTFK